MPFRIFAILLCLAAPDIARGDDIDSDGDGLSDFQEIHKYFTNPRAADSDGDGIRDDDWHERGFWNAECYLRIPADQFAKMTPGVPYLLAPAKTEGQYQWKVEGGVKIVRPKSLVRAKKSDSG